MKVKVLIGFALTMGALMVSVPLFAHHGNAEFETEKTVTVKGTVTEWFWANPHCFLKFDEKTDNGEVRHWVVEAGPPPDYINSGFGRQTFKPGDQVTVTMHQVKDPKRTIGRILKVVLPDGRVFPGPGGAGNSAK